MILTRTQVDKIFDVLRQENNIFAPKVPFSHDQVYGIKPTLEKRKYSGIIHHTEDSLAGASETGTLVIYYKDLSKTNEKTTLKNLMFHFSKAGASVQWRSKYDFFVSVHVDKESYGPDQIKPLALINGYEMKT